MIIWTGTTSLKRVWINNYDTGLFFDIRRPSFASTRCKLIAPEIALSRRGSERLI